MVFQVVLVGYAGTNVIKKQPLQGEHALGEASRNPHTHQLGCQVQAKALIAEMEVAPCYTKLQNRSQNLDVTQGFAICGQSDQPSEGFFMARKK